MTKSIAVIGDKETVTSAVSHNLVAAGFELATSAEDADVAVTYCLDEQNLENVYFGDSGLVVSMKKGSYMVDLSPSTPSSAQEVATMAQVGNKHALDAPLFVRDITAADAFADPDNLVALVGGDKDDFEAVKDVVFAVAAKAAFCGEAGEGQRAKAAFTMEQAQSLVALVESQRLLSGSADHAKAAAHRMVLAGLLPEGAEAVQQAIAERRFEGTYTVEVMDAEVREARTLVEDEGLTLPQSEAAESLLRMTSIIGGVDMSPAVLALVYTDRETCEKYGLDWDRAEEAARVLGNADGHHDGDDDVDGGGSDAGFGFGPSGDSFGGTIGGLPTD